MRRSSVSMLVTAVISVACPCLSFVSSPGGALLSSRILASKAALTSSPGYAPGYTQGTWRDTPSTTTPARTGAIASSRRTIESTTTSLRAAHGKGWTVLRAAEDAVAAEGDMDLKPPTPPAPQESNLPFFLDPSTRGGAVVVPVLSLLLPLGAYGALTAVGVDGNKAGAWVGVGYTLIGLIAWVGSYFFRVATKNMTYAVQLKNYEQAVIEKRFSELEDGEVDALLDEVNET